MDTELLGRLKKHLLASYLIFIKLNMHGNALIIKKLYENIKL
jgi:hypothetical protein